MSKKNPTNLPVPVAGNGDVLQRILAAMPHQIETQGFDHDDVNDLLFALKKFLIAASRAAKLDDAPKVPPHHKQPVRLSPGIEGTRAWITRMVERE